MSVKVLNVKEDILGANEEKAKKNRELLDKNHNILINIMSSPGAGKTSLIMQTINRFKDKISIAVIEGDIASTIDADKISSQDIPVIQINTAGACHLDAIMIEKALDKLALEETDLVIIENVGNLVCPAEFALGAHKTIMLLSVPEGDDKPHKYPLMFTEADVVLVNKTDVMPYFDFDIKAFSAAVSGLNPSARILPVSAKTGEGLELWFSWLEDMLK
ncbi:MAG: hydrogenase nickel incorporation protein HypB [Deltaproteobacteria bacterium]|jgi:hydrogenase nickel incorporation protein HypB|nr:hydrogenase nickel incorporation protein HypB [Deltaproteobacteria bacterium]